VKRAGPRSHVRTHEMKPEIRPRFDGISMNNFFESPFKGVTLDRQVTNPNIVVGRLLFGLLPRPQFRRLRPFPFP
jgi:hypothetical protein